MDVGTSEQRQSRGRAELCAPRPPPPPGSAPSAPSRPHPPPDPDPPPRGLAGDGSGAPVPQPQKEIEAVQGMRQPPLPESTGQIGDGGTHLPSIPTVIDPSLKEQAQALFPQLADDLNKIREGAEQLRDGGGSAIDGAVPIGVEAPGASRAFKRPGRAPSVKSTGAGGALGSCIQDELLNSRIPASQKGKSVQWEKSSYGALLEPWRGAAGPSSLEGGGGCSNGASDTRSTWLHKPSLEDDEFEEGWEHARKQQRKKSAAVQGGIESYYQPMDRARDSRIFREKMEGRCFC